MADISAMIPGFARFEEAFRNDAGFYVVIGGAARELIYADTGAWQSTATKDLDVVLIAEAIDANFVSKFMRFVKTAGYTHVTKTGDCQLYRFTAPEDLSYPQQIELLGRKPDYLIGVEAIVGKVLVDSVQYSLSAILLDDDYYSLLASGVAVTRKYGIPTLAHEYLPVFKMRAFNDLSDKRKRGEAIREGEIGKHRRDVFRLVSIMPPKTQIDLPRAIRDEIERFLDNVTLPSRNYMKSIGLGNTTLEQIKGAIRSTYLGDALRF